MFDQLSWYRMLRLVGEGVVVAVVVMPVLGMVVMTEAELRGIVGMNDY